MVTNPPFLSAKILPGQYKTQVVAKILEHIDWLVQHSLPVGRWQHVIDFMTSEDNSALLPKFIDYTSNLDKIRNQDSAMVFPELESVLCLEHSTI
jgi:hypothetical protein